MSVLVLFRWKGDPDELLAAYDREFEHPVPRQQPQRMSHTCARADDGVVIVDVWHSREDFQKMMGEDFQKMMEDPEFQKNLEAAGWPTKPQLVEVYEVHASII
jgi:hypothetical protein